MATIKKKKSKDCVSMWQKATKGRPHRAMYLKTYILPASKDTYSTFMYMPCYMKHAVAYKK